MLTSTVAAELNVSRWAVLKAIERKKLTATKYGRDWLIKRVDFEKYRTERQRPGRPRAQP